MKTHPSLRTSVLLLLTALGAASSFARVAPYAPAFELVAQISSGTGSSTSGASGTGTSGTSGSTSDSGSVSGSTGSFQPGTPTPPGNVQPGTPDQPGLPTQPGTPDQPGLPTQPGTPDQPGLPRQPGVPDQPGVPTQPGQPDPTLPRDPTVGTTTTTTTTVVDPNAVGVNADGTRVVGGTVVDGSILDTRGATQQIEATTFSTRDRALRQVERSSTLGAGYIGMIERNTATLTGEGRTQVTDAIRRANAARTELDKAISLARSANERRWADARAELLERYRAYDQALAEAREAAIAAGAQVDGQAGTTSNSGM